MVAPAIEAPVADDGDSLVIQPTAPPTTNASPPVATDAPPVEKEAPPEAPPAAEEKPDLLAGIDAIDATELLERHPGLKRLLDSRAGNLATKRLPDLEKELEAKILARFQTERERELAKADDLVALGDLRKRQLEAEETAEGQTEAAQRAEQARSAVRGEVEVVAATEIGNALWETVKDSLDADTQRALTKDWGPGVAGVKAFAVETFQAAIAAGVAKGIAERLPKIKQETEAAFAKDGNAQALAEEPSPDTRGGANAITNDDFARAFARGESNDFARGAAWLASLDDTPALGRAGR